MHVCVLRSNKCYFFGRLCVCTLWMVPNSIFVDASMMHLIAIVLQIFREKSWFGLVTNYKKKCVRKPILANLGTRIFKIFSSIQTKMTKII